VDKYTAYTDNTRCSIQGEERMDCDVFQVQDSARQAHDLKLTELPEKWQNFYNFADKIGDDKLRKTALNRFLEKDPPLLTVENYETLRGTELYAPQRRNSLNLTIKGNDDVQKLIILDYDFTGEE